MQDYLAAHAGWITAALVAVISLIAVVMRDVAGWASSKTTFKLTDKSHAELLQDHEARIRNVESAHAEMRNELKGVSTDVHWIRRHMEREDGGK